jgi:transcriptional regulator with XRE-family HTH domain
MDMTSEDLRAWQAQMKFKQQQAADALGVSLAAYKDWLRGVSRNSGKPIEIDKRTGLACASLAAGLPEFSMLRRNEK